MNYVEISDLLTKGLTPEQIVKLAGANTPEPTPEPSPDPTPDPTPEPTLDPSPEMKALRDEMKALKEAIQAQNIITQHIDNIPPSSESTESILAGFIRPPFENKKD